MKKVITLMVTLLVFLISCTNNNTQEVSIDEEISNLNQNDTIFEECKINQSEKSKEFIGDVYKIDKNCLFNKANTVEICKSYFNNIIYHTGFTTHKFLLSDVDQCINSLAIRNNNTTICDQAGNLVHTCYKTIAINTVNPELCKKFPEITVDCYRSLSNVEQCKEEADNYLVEVIPCLYNNLEIKEGDIDLTDTTICSFIENFEYIEDSDKACIAGIGAYLNDTSICNSAGGYKADCWTVIAKNNPSFTLSDCNKAGVDYIGCYVAIAIAKEDRSICLELPVGHKTNCLRQVAIKIVDPDICMEVDEPQYKQDCVNQVLNLIGQENYTYHHCDIISQFNNWRPNQCFYEVGLRDLDLDACNKIQGEDTVKSECIERVQHALANS